MAKEINPRIEWVSLDEIVKWARNPKDHDVGLISQSFHRFGFVKPLLVDEGTGKLVAGHGRLDTLQMLKKRGKDVPAGIKLDGEDWQVSVIRGIAFEDEEEAEAFLLADNRTSEQGGWMESLLSDVLQDHVHNLTGTGFDGDDLDELMESLYPEDPEEPQKEPEQTISPELFERHDYIVFYFDNEIDWQRIVDEFNIETVQTGPVGKKTEELASQQRGLGRVIDGKVLLQKVSQWQS